MIIMSVFMWGHLLQYTVMKTDESDPAVRIINQTPVKETWTTQEQLKKKILRDNFTLKLPLHTSLHCSSLQWDKLKPQMP